MYRYNWILIVNASLINRVIYGTVTSIYGRAMAQTYRDACIAFEATRLNYISSLTLRVIAAVSRSHWSDALPCSVYVHIRTDNIDSNLCQHSIYKQHTCLNMGVYHVYPIDFGQPMAYSTILTRVYYQTSLCQNSPADHYTYLETG